MRSGLENRSPKRSVHSGTLRCNTQLGLLPCGSKTGGKPGVENALPEPLGVLELRTGFMQLTVRVSVNHLALTAPLALPDGRFRFTITGSAPQGFVIQASSNLTTWMSLATNTLSGGKFDYTNTGLTNTPLRFYRTRSPL